MNSVTSLHQQQTPKKSRTNISPPNPSRFALSIHRFSNPQSSTLHPSTHLPSPTLENSYPSLLFPLPSTRSNSPSPFPLPLNHPLHLHTDPTPHRLPPTQYSQPRTLASRANPSSHQSTHRSLPTQHAYSLISAPRPLPIVSPVGNEDPIDRSHPPPPFQLVYSRKRNLTYTLGREERKTGRKERL
jgi:hypothetical protein